MNYLTQSEKDTKNLGERYGKACKGGEVFLLSGELGGGKTQFVKGLARGLGISEPILSPTFTYERIYQGQEELCLYHFDLYRSEKIDPDIAELVKESILTPKSVVAIEWAERAREIWPSKYTLLEFKWVTENERKIIITEK